MVVELWQTLASYDHPIAIAIDHSAELMMAMEHGPTICNLLW